ncbi:nonstructural protein [Capybara microvirus Cap3_SP_450]|nr:nonstructural protein [Capybara microvirus Cap3_SP_450]
MTTALFVIRDELSTCGAPESYKDDLIAKRHFLDVCLSVPMIKNSPKDFSLWRIGYFDDETMKVEACKPELIIRAEALLNGKN